MGKNPKDFLTQRVALEGEDQLRWVGGFPSHVSPILLPSCDSLVHVLACDSSCSLHLSGYECPFLSNGFWFDWTYKLLQGSDGRVSFDWRTEGGRIAEVATVRAACA